MDERPVLTVPSQTWLLLGAGLLLGYVAFRTGVDFSARWIWYRPEYGHGLIIPFVSAFSSGSGAANSNACPLPVRGWAWACCCWEWR